jgi:hypothetical protein
MILVTIQPRGSAAQQCGKACLSEKSLKIFRGYASKVYRQKAGIACTKISIPFSGKASLTALGEASLNATF